MQETATVPLVEMRNISKTFGHIRALNAVSLKFFSAEVHGLVGENGAGKSTLIKVLSGAYVADAGGEILLNGQALSIQTPVDSRRLGIAVIYQEMALAPNLTVAENIFLGRERIGRHFSRAALMRAAAPILAEFDVSFTPHTQLGHLSMGEQQIVEIAKAVSSHARLIVMDEPTTSLSVSETEHLFDIIATLKARGIAIVYISHRMDEIYELADRVSVLRDASHVGILERAELSDDRLVKMMVGRTLSSFYTKNHHHREEEVIFELKDFGDATHVKNCSFKLYKGEVLGIAGLVGAGRTELAHMIFGARPATTGSIHIKGQEVHIKSPRHAMDHAIAYLTEDRKGLGLFLDMTISDNINLEVMDDDAWGGLLDFSRAAQRADKAIQFLSIRCSGRGAFVGALSGGNQQKILFARLIEARPTIFILDEPTRGVDIGAKSEIYHLIDQMACQGVGIIMISSDMPEIIGTCDRTLIMREGLIVGELERAAFTQEKIIAFATGIKQKQPL